MSSPRVLALLLATVAAFTFLGSMAMADQVDDLLAGKPVLIEESPTQPVENAKPAAKGTLTSALHEEAETHVGERLVNSSLNQDTWHVALVETTPHVDPSLVPPVRRRTPPVAFNMVPEPSAIGLASLALVYFLLFFRRRYAL